MDYLVSCFMFAYTHRGELDPGVNVSFSLKLDIGASPVLNAPDFPVNQRFRARNMATSDDAGVAFEPAAALTWSSEPAAGIFVAPDTADGRVAVITGDGTTVGTFTVSVAGTGTDGKAIKGSFTVTTTAVVTPPADHVIDNQFTFDAAEPA